MELLKTKIKIVNFEQVVDSITEKPGDGTIFMFEIPKGGTTIFVHGKKHIEKLESRRFKKIYDAGNEACFSTSESVIEATHRLHCLFC